MRESQDMALPTDRGAACVPADTAVAVEETFRGATFEAVYEYALPRLYGFVRSQVHNRELAEELLGCVLIKGYARWGRERCDHGTVLWLFKTARTTLIDYWRGDGKRERASIPVEELEDVQEPGLSPEAAYAQKERQAMLLRAMAYLDEEDRVILALKFAGERTNREIAPIVGLSEGAVSMRLLRALRALRERFRTLGVS